MRRCWGWILAWMTLLCLMWSVSLHARDHRHDRCRPKQAITWKQKSRPLASYENTRIVSRTSIRSRAGPQQIFFSPDVFLGVEDLDPVGPPWLEYRGPPHVHEKFGHSCGFSVAMVATGAPVMGINSQFHSASATFDGQN